MALLYEELTKLAPFALVYGVNRSRRIRLAGFMGCTTRPGEQFCESQGEDEAGKDLNQRAQVFVSKERRMRFDLLASVLTTSRVLVSHCFPKVKTCKHLLLLKVNLCVWRKSKQMAKDG